MFYSLHINFPPNPFATMLTVSCALHYCTHSLLFSLKYSLNHNSGSRYPMLVGFLCLSTPFGDSSYPSRVVSIKSCKGLAARAPGLGLCEAAQHNRNTPHSYNATESKTPSISLQSYMTFCSCT